MQLDWGSDPFRSSTIAEPIIATLRKIGAVPVLSGISIRGTDRRALIDREIVREGDTLHSRYTVERIEKNRVTLLRDEQELTLSIGDEQ